MRAENVGWLPYLFDVNNRQRRRRQTENINNEYLDHAGLALMPSHISSLPSSTGHCSPLSSCPDESEQRQLTDRVGEFTTAGHLWPRDDQSTSSHSLIAGRLISSFEPGVSSARTPNMSFPGPKIKPTTYSSAASSKCLCAPSTCLLQLPDNLLTFSLLTSN